jgi:3-oxoacyl-(acyl-carrier-protein) synthase/acyl carrier protein
MDASNFEATLSQVKIEFTNCEKVLFQMINERSNMSENTNIINQTNKQLQQTNIEIIGMASIFPKSNNLQEYWQNIIQKVDCITDVPPSRWSIEDYYNPDPKAPDQTYCKRGGFIPDIDFNPMEFGLPPNILEVTDISQLLGLVVAKEAMEDAGYSESRQFNRERTGVILRVAIGRQLAIPLGARLQYPIWEKVLKNSGLSEVDTQKVIDKVKSAYVQWDENSFPGMLANVISGRIANRLDLGGMNCVVDAAYASSLGALKMAISELVEHRADMMITGRVDTDNSIFAYMCFSKTPAVSPGDKVKAFDVDYDGMILAEGLGMLVVKRLEDAVRDSDRIYAVIKGIGSSSDGKYKSIYAPHSEGQIKALRRAYENAGYSPETVGLIEAHGTGTMVGDPTEFTSIKEVFGENNSQTQYIALGRVKSQIGHTKAAAGAASLIKTALALHHKVLPPTINITKPHPKLNIENSPFYLNTETRPWISNQPRRAGVSAFGFGGTNYHVVLEEYENEHYHSYRLHNTAKSILLFASTTQELLSCCEDIQRQLTSPEKERHYQKRIRGSQSLEIPVNYVRIGFVADSLTQAEELLRISINQLRNKPEAGSWEHPKGIYYRQKGIETTGKIVALFFETKIPEVNKKKVLNVRLNSTNITHKAQKAFAQALENGHQISANSPQAEPEPTFATTTITLPTIREDLEEEYSYATSVNNDVNYRNNSNLEKVPIQLPNYDRVIDSLEHYLAEFTRQQRDIIHVHEQSLQNQTEYTKTFYELRQQQYKLLENGDINEYQAQTQQLAISSSERNMMRLHDHQADTLRIHEKYLNYQQDYANNYFQLLHKHYNFLLFTDNIPVRQEHLVEETNRKTSVNRSGANISPSFAGEGLGEKLISPPKQEEQLEENSNTITVIPTIPINVDTSTLGQTLLSIVSDKTGYPVEILDLSMDIKADLGIDSIKRVEILGGLLELYPDLPKPNPEELGQLRTLGQIAEYIKTLVIELLNQKVEVSEATNFPVQMLVKVPHQDVANEPQILESHPNVANTESLISSSEDDVKQSTGDEMTQIVERVTAITIPADLSNVLLTIVSDKTGYPAEMLELSMDIETDLRIDSIKQLEILGGLLEPYPDLPRPNPEELAELKTLGQIVEYIQHQAQGVTKLLINEKEEFTSTELHAQILRSQAKLKSLSQPDALEFIIPEIHVILITHYGCSTTEELATSLIAKGVKPVVLSFPNIQSNLPAEINRVTLTDWYEKTLQQQLINIADNFGAVATFIHLNPVFSGSSEIEKSILRHIFLIAKHLKTSLNEAAKKSRSCFLCFASLDGEFGLGNTTNFSPISAGLFGLTKSLNQKWESVFCRSLDLSPDLDPQTSVRHILAEIHDPNLLVTEVGYSSKGRFTLVAEPCSLSLQSQIINPQSQVFLVSGGAKGITAQCVIKLAQQYQCKFILLGRSSTEKEAVWAEDC